MDTYQGSLKGSFHHACLEQCAKILSNRTMTSEKIGRTTGSGFQHSSTNLYLGQCNTKEHENSFSLFPLHLFHNYNRKSAIWWLMTSFEIVQLVEEISTIKW